MLHVCMFTHLFGVDKVSSGAKTRVGIGYSGDSDDDGQGEESLGNHFVCGCTGWIFTLLLRVCCLRFLSLKNEERNRRERQVD